MWESKRKVVLMFLRQNPSRYSKSKLGDDDVIHRDLITKLVLTHRSFFSRGH